MRVKSPLGEFPIQFSQMKIRKGALIIEGSMATWPTSIRVYPMDMLRILRILPWYFVAVTLLIAATLVGLVLYI